MIILIGGASCTGKTRIAFDLMKKYKIPYFSLDVLMMGIFRSNNKCGYTPMSDEESINKVLWPVIYQMIKTNIENETDYIYEGIQILPGNICEIENDYRHHVKAYFLNFTTNYLINRYNSISEYRNVIESRTDIDTIETSINKNSLVSEKCMQSNQAIFSIDCDYIKEKNHILKIMGKDIEDGISK